MIPDTHIILNNPVSPKWEKLYFQLLPPWGKACPGSAGVGEGGKQRKIKNKLLLKTDSHI
jgi:hypothetical protein